MVNLKERLSQRSEKFRKGLTKNVREGTKSVQKTGKKASKPARVEKRFKKSNVQEFALGVEKPKFFD